MIERADGRRDVGVYCIKDTILPLDLIRKLNILPNLIEMAKVTCVPLSYLLEKGQQIKVFSQLVYEGGKNGFLVPTLEKKKTL
mgnify:CR=1 FL=1